jgi:hypothetical protein
MVPLLQFDTFLQRSEPRRPGTALLVQFDPWLLEIQFTVEIKARVV